MNILCLKKKNSTQEPFQRTSMVSGGYVRTPDVMMNEIKYTNTINNIPYISCKRSSLTSFGKYSSKKAKGNYVMTNVLKDLCDIERELNGFQSLYFSI